MINLLLRFTKEIKTHFILWLFAELLRAFKLVLIYTKDQASNPDGNAEQTSKTAEATMLLNLYIN